MLNTDIQALLQGLPILNRDLQVGVVLDTLVAMDNNTTGIKTFSVKLEQLLNDIKYENNPAHTQKLEAEVKQIRQTIAFLKRSNEIMGQSLQKPK